MAERKLPKLETGVRFPSPARSERSRRTEEEVAGAVGHRSFERTLLDTVGRRLADLAAQSDQRRRAAAFAARPGRGRRGDGRPSRPRPSAGSAPDVRDPVHVGVDRDRVVDRARTTSPRRPSSGRRPGATSGTRDLVVGGVADKRREVVADPRARGSRAGSPGSDGAFVFASPPERIASATRRARRTNDVVPRGERGAQRANARSALRSLVCCESTVRISSSSGSARRGGSSAPHRFTSRSRIARTRRRSGRGRRSGHAARRVWRYGTASATARSPAGCCRWVRSGASR